jgi:DUF971 family protein
VSSTRPRAITRSDPSRVAIEWDDGHTTVYRTSELRRICPCARCVDELTGAALLDPVTVAEDMSQSDVRLVGNYAISVQFADGHDTGIYPFKMLRDRDPGTAVT